METQRKQLLIWIKQACQAGARLCRTCDIVGLSVRTVQRWQKADSLQDGRLTPLRRPHNALDDLERQRLLKVVNQPEYAALSPNQIVPLLADEGVYIASESTFYRVLKAEGLSTHRGSSQPAKPRHKPKALVADAPNQLYSWDITYLPTDIKGFFFYLYLILDIYSRKIVGWQVHESECSDLAANLMVDVCHWEGIEPGQVVLHSDNGSPMKGASMLATLQQLGVIPSFSRPSVSNDNPYSEALFKTLKYRPEYPSLPFKTLADAREWIADFVCWYNHEHLHSAIKFVTPAQRHTGEDIAILAKRDQVYQTAKTKYPQRWSGKTRNWEPIKEVLLNPDKVNENRTNINEAA